MKEQTPEFNSKEKAKQFLSAYRSEAKHEIKGIDDPFLHQMFFEYGQSLIASLPASKDKEIEELKAQIGEIDTCSCGEKCHPKFMSYDNQGYHATCPICIKEQTDNMVLSFGFKLKIANEKAESLQSHLQSKEEEIANLKVELKNSEDAHDTTLEQLMKAREEWESKEEMLGEAVKKLKKIAATKTQGEALSEIENLDTFLSHLDQEKEQK